VIQNFGLDSVWNSAGSVLQWLVVIFSWIHSFNFLFFWTLVAAVATFSSFKKYLLSVHKSSWHMKICHSVVSMHSSTAPVSSLPNTSPVLPPHCWGPSTINWATSLGEQIKAPPVRSIVKGHLSWKTDLKASYRRHIACMYSKWKDSLRSLPFCAVADQTGVQNIIYRSTWTEPHCEMYQRVDKAA